MPIWWFYMYGNFHSCIIKLPQLVLGLVFSFQNELKIGCSVCGRDGWKFLSCIKIIKKYSHGDVLDRKFTSFNLHVKTQWRVVFVLAAPGICVYAEQGFCYPQMNSFAYARHGNYWTPADSFSFIPFALTQKALNSSEKNCSFSFHPLPSLGSF